MRNKKQNRSLQKVKKNINFIFLKNTLINYIVKWFLISLIIGICVGTMSSFFIKSLDWVTNFRENHQWIIFLLPIAGFLIGSLYYYFGTEVESGNNLLFESINNPNKKIPFRLAPLVFIGTLITHFFGGSAGREGTAVQMSSAIADQLAKPFKLDIQQRKILIIAAVSAGFGSIFGTPIAGAIFGLEVFLIGKLSYAAIIPAFTSSFFADFVTRFLNTKHTNYLLKFVPKISLENIFYSIFAGLIFGLCSIIFCKSIHFLTKFFNKKNNFLPLKLFIGGVIIVVTFCIVGNTKYLGLGIPTILQSFNQSLSLNDVMLKMAITLVTLASGFKGGETTPLFFIGAVLGNVISFFIPIPFNILAAMGFVAVFAAASNTPIACIFMGIEIFGIESVLYIAIACIISYLISGNNSIYALQIIKKPSFNSIFS